MRARVAEILSNEIWLAQRLRRHGAYVFEGVTDRDTRRERVRAAILAHGLAQVIVGRGQDRKPRTYAEVFEAIYGEPLDPGDGNKRKSAAPKNSPHSAPSRLSQSARGPQQLTLGDPHERPTDRAGDPG